MNNSRHYIYQLATFVFAFLLISSCSGDEEESGGRGQGFIPTVEVIETVMGGLPLEERLTGTVRARNQTGIYPEITSVVTEILVNSGDPVVEGQPLVKLRDRESQERLRQAESGLQIARAQVRQAEANVDRLQSRLGRVQTLSVRNLESQLELEQLEAEVESARAALSLAEAQKEQASSIVEERKNELGFTTIKATTDGFVGNRSVELGQQVNPSMRIFEIGDTRRMTIRISLTERMLAYIATGQTVNITSDAFGGEVIQTTLTRISPFLNPVTNAADAEIELDNPDGLLRSGMFVTVDILYGESDQAVLVPNNALFNNPNDGRRGVYVADHSALSETGQLERGSIIGPVPISFVPVQVVAQGRQVSGIRGIENGDMVVTIGHNLIAAGRDQSRIRIIEWDRILELQQLQNRDILELIRRKLAERNHQNEEV